jgi:hypothetical protein
MKRTASDTEATGRLYIEPYENIKERFDLKLKKEYRFKVNPLREHIGSITAANMLMQQLEKNIADREAKGVD